ncbi:MAG TPA: GNAT family N-acetyltransferase [Pirellulaceae bacterium]|nr:GNAT family N-acetyltransferase [Pirellulaceae bacterium]
MQVHIADLNQPLHADAVVELLDMYCQDFFGKHAPLENEVRYRVIRGLKEAGGTCFLASDGEAFVGLAICLPSYSSFRARPVLNIHDLAVAAEHRGKGIGRALLAAVEEEARRRGCAKITLEVRSDNALARDLYRRCGFRGTEPETLFWSREL